MILKILIILLIVIMCFEIVYKLYMNPESDDYVLFRVYLIEGISLVLIVNTLIIFFQAILSIFNSLNYALTLAVIDCMFFLSIIKKGKCIEKFKKKRCWKHSLIIIILFVFGVAYNYVYSTEWTTGWRDYSCYYYQAIHIVDKGTIYYNAEINQEDYNAVKEISTLTYSGLNVSGFDDAGNVNFSFHFLNLYPALLSFLYFLGGTKFLLGSNALIGMCALYYSYCIMSRLMPWKHVVICSLILFFNPAEIWNNRITVSETLCQLLLFSAIFYLYDAKDSFRNKDGIILSAFLLSLIHLAKIDMYIISVGVMIFFCYYVLAYGLSRTMKNWLLIYLSLMVIWTAVCFYCNSDYMIMHWEMGVLDKITYLLVGMIALYGICLYIYKKKGMILNNIRVDKILSLRNIDMRIAMILVSTFIVVGMKIALTNDDVLFFSNLNVLGWYVSLPIIAFLPIGAYLLLNRVRDNVELALILFIFAINFFIYIYNPSIASDHMWASRRWVTIIIPLVIYIGLYGVLLFESKIIYIICCGILIFTEIQGGQAFINHRILNGCVDHYDTVADCLVDTERYFVADKNSAVILRVVYGKNVYILDDFSQINSYLNDNSKLYFVGFKYDEAWKSQLPSNVEYESIENIDCEILDLEKSSEHLPNYTYYQNYGMTLYEIVSIE